MSNCDTCKYWDLMSGSILGYCKKLMPGNEVTVYYDGDNKAINYSVDGFITRDDFGCNQYEKEE